MLLIDTKNIHLPHNLLSKSQQFLSWEQSKQHVVCLWSPYPSTKKDVSPELLLLSDLHQLLPIKIEIPVSKYLWISLQKWCKINYFSDVLYIITHEGSFHRQLLVYLVLSLLLRQALSVNYSDPRYRQT